MKTPKRFYSLLIVLTTIFILGLFGTFKPIRGLAERKIIFPLRQKVFDLRLSAKKEAGECQLKEEREIAELKAKIASLEEENFQQKRLLSSPLPKAWKFQTVRLIGVENESLLIGAGERDGLRKGMVAVIGNTYLGKVHQVSQSMATVRLPSFVEEKLAVSVIGAESRLLTGRGLLIGRGEGGMKLEQVLSVEDIRPNDVVQIDVLGGVLAVGIIEEVMIEKGEMFKSATVKRQYSPWDLRTVFLVNN